MRKIQFIISIFLLINTFSNSRTSKSVKKILITKTSKEKTSNQIFNKTFFLVTKTDSIDILYHFCSANINTIKVYKDSIWEDFGQEDYTMIVRDIEIKDTKIKFLGSLNEKEPIDEYTFDLLDKNKGYWKINNKIYVDSLKINKISEFWELYKKCWDDESIYVAQSILKRDPHNPIAFFNIAEFYWENKKYSKAREAYLKYIKYMNAQGKKNKILNYVNVRISSNTD